MSDLSSVHRLILGVACVFVLGSPLGARAQVPSGCELRIGSGSVGGSLSLPLAEANVDYGRAGDGSWTELNTRAGRGWSAEGSLPILPGWGARVDYTRGHIAIERTVTRPPFYSPERTREGAVTVRHLTAAVVHAVSPPGQLCAYVGGGIGLYQFDYRGQRGRNRGLFAVGGIEIPVGERSGLGLEVQLHAAHNNYEGALRAETVLMLKPAVVFRVHF